MKTRRGAVCLLQAALIFAATPLGLAQQRTPEVRRAQPVDEPPTPRAATYDTPVPSAKPRRSPPEPSAAPKPSNNDNPEPPAADAEASDRRQLSYATGLYSLQL